MDTNNFSFHKEVKEYKIPINPTPDCLLIERFPFPECTIHNIFFRTNLVKLRPFGSWVYGSNSEDSDRDYIAVVENYPEYGSKYVSKHLDIDFFTVSEWEMMINNYDVRAMEVCFAENNPIEITDRALFRKSFSTIFNGSWVKGKKKLTTSDYEPYLAIKSVFHSLRILDFGLQILRDREIGDFSSMNYVLDDLKKMAKQYHRAELWEKIEDKYLKVFKDKKLLYNELAPKVTKKQQITDVLNKHSITPTKQLIKDLNDIL